MEMLKMLKTRRTIRKFTEQKVEREKLEKIAEAGLYAPNAGGGQGAKIIMIEDFDLIRKSVFIMPIVKTETGMAEKSMMISHRLLMI